MRAHTLILIVVLLSTSLAGAKAQTQDTNTVEIIKQLQRRVEELEQRLKALERIPQAVPAPNDEKEKQRIEELNQKVRELERDRDLDRETAKTKGAEAPKITLGEGGFLFSSADENFKFRVRGYVQADSRFYLGDTKNAFTDTFLLNRVRPVFEGTVFKDYDFKLMPDFGQGRAVIQDAYLDAHFVPWLNLRVGKYKGPVSLERLQSARDLIFVERALPTDLVPNRDIGPALHGDFLGGSLGYEVGVFNGSVDGNSSDVDENDSKDVEGRIFAHPFKKTAIGPLQGLGIGIAGTTGHENGRAPSYLTVGQQTFFSFNSGVTAKGDRQRIAPQAYYYWGPFGLLGEYVVSSQDVNKGPLTRRLDNWAWQVASSFVLTGEKASYTGVAPAKPFDWQKGQWGAFEVAARVSQLHVDDDAFHNFGTVAAPVTLADTTKSASEATSWGLGLNWYLNRSVKLNLDYEQAQFHGGAPKGDRADERVLFTRVQIAF
jgi:phosphate-selective porin OprO and OprP